MICASPQQIRLAFVFFCFEVLHISDILAVVLVACLFVSHRPWLPAELDRHESEEKQDGSVHQIGNDQKTVGSEREAALPDSGI